MKNCFKWGRFVLLQAVPVAFFAFSLVATLQVLLEKSGLALSGVVSSGVLSLICFLILGISSVVSFFEKTGKWAGILKYTATVPAIIYVAFQAYQFALYYGFWNSGILSLEGILEVLALTMLVVCCFLKDKFYKLKWSLTLLVAVLLLLCEFVLPMTAIDASVDRFLLRYALNLFIFAYFYCTVAIVGLMPKKTM